MYEYMAAGKPVITTKLPGVMKEFGRNNGVLYVDKPEGILEKAIGLVKRGDVKKQGKKARKFAGKHNWDEIVTQFEKVLRELV